MCEFCDNFDWGESKVTFEKYYGGDCFVHIANSGGYYRFPVEEQFNFCPVCGNPNPLKKEQSFGKWVSESILPPTTGKVHKYGYGTDITYEETERVLCACQQRSGKRFVKEGYCQVFSNGTRCWRVPGTVNKVTHWMPLPKIPNELINT